MNYSEAAYFDGNHCQHVVAKLESERLRRIERRAEAAVARNPKPFDRHNPTGQGWHDEYGRECG